MSLTASKVKGSISVGRVNGFDVLPVGPDGYILSPDSVQPSGLKWASPGSTFGVGLGLAGLWIYGDGADGNLTLVANTTLAAGDSVKRYNNLTLAGFTLTFDVLDYYAVIYVKETLSGGGGSISAKSRGQGTLNAGGVGTPGTGTIGGDGGYGTGSIYVYARTISTSVTIDARGGDGLFGAGGTAMGAGGGSAGTNCEFFTSNSVLMSKTYIKPGLVNQFGLPNGIAGGSEGLTTNTAAELAEVRRTCRDLLRAVLGMVQGRSVYDYTLFAPVGPPEDFRWNRSTGGGGGGSGGANTGGLVDTGDGAGGGRGVVGDGGNGGLSVGAAITVNIAGGGSGGGGGAGGGVAVLICEDVLAATSVLASGGLGGPGGDADAPAAIGGSLACGGGGGGGGGGGLAVAIMKTGSGFVTVSGAGGTGGAFGLGESGGAPNPPTDGAPGIAGGAGIGYLLPKA
jgi:hypothetical protein